MTNQQAHEIIRAQAALLAHLAERIAMLQVAFEAHLHDQIGESGPKHDAHYKRRKAMFAEDFPGTTSGLIQTLRKALAMADRQPGQDRPSDPLQN